MCDQLTETHTPLSAYKYTKLINSCKKLSQRISSPTRTQKKMMKSSESTATRVPEGVVEGRGKGIAAPTTMVASSSKAVKHNLSGGLKRGLAIFDFFLRLIGIAAALAATTIMGTTDETLPFFTQFIQFKASYNDLPAFTFFVIANGAASGYLVLSLPFSIISIVRPHTVQARLILLIFDTIMVVLTTAGASAAAAIVYLAHKGNTSANWIAICQQFNGFCERISGAVVASFIATVIFVLLVLFASVALRRH